MKELHKSEYESTLKKYDEGTKIRLIESGSIGVEFGINLSNGNKQLGDFLSSLSKMVLEYLGLKDIYNIKTDEYKNTLKEFINNFSPDYGWHVDSFDANNFTKGEIDDKIVFYLFRYGSIKKEITGVKMERNNDTGKGCWVIPLDKLNADCEKLFGVKINTNNKNVREGSYYLYVGNDDEGEESGKVDNQIVNLYQIADDVYCVNLKIFNSYSYGNFYKTGYAIVKEVEIDGRKTFQLLKYNNNGDMLTADQIQSYEKQYNPETKVINSTSTVVNNNVRSNATSIAVYCVISGVSSLVIGCGIYYKNKRKKNK